MAILIGVNGERSEFVLPCSGSSQQRLVAVQGAVGGYVELVNLPDGRVVLCDEDGLLKSAPFNREASRETGIRLVGPVLLCSQAEIRRWDASQED